MAAQRYEISLRVLKHVLRVSAANECNSFQHEKRNYLSPRSHVIGNTIEIPNHFTLIFFCCKRCNLLWSHSNSDLFHGIMFSCNSLPGISKVKGAVPQILSKFKEWELPPN